MTLRAGPLSVGELADTLPVSRPAVSRHLRVLEKVGLVTARREGSKSLYRVHVAGFAPARSFLDEFWDTALNRLLELAEK